MSDVNVGTISAVLKLKNELSAEIAKVSKDLQTKVENIKKAGRDLESFGDSLTKYVTLPLAAVSAAAVKTATDLNKSLANISSLLTDQTGAELDATLGKMKEDIRSLAVDMGKSTTDMSEGLYEVISSLGMTNDTLDQLSISAKAGAAGLATTQEAFNFLSAVTKTYGDTSQEAFKKAADLGFQAVNFGQTTFPQLAASIGGVAPLAKVAGVSMEEMFATIATATGVTGNTVEVTTQMSAAISALLNPSKELKEAYDRLGVASGEAAVKEFGFVGALQQISKYAQETGQPLAQLLGRKEAFVLTASLAGAQAQKFAANLDAMGQAAKANGKVINDAFAKQTQGINKAGFEWEQFKVKVTVELQKLGEVLIPLVSNAGKMLSPLFEAFRSVVKWMNELSPASQKVVFSLGLIVAATGPVLSVTGRLIVAWGTLIEKAPKLAAAIKLAFAPAAVVVGISVMLVWINDLITKWGEASDAATQYQLRAAQATGKALQATQGLIAALNNAPGGKVSSGFFSNAVADAENLKKVIVETQESINKFYRDTSKSGAGLDPKLRNQGPNLIKPTELIKQEESLKSLMSVYSRLMTSLAGAKVQTEALAEANKEVTNSVVRLNDEQQKALDQANRSIEDLRRQAEQMEAQARAAISGEKTLIAKRNAQEADNAVLQIAQGLAEQGVSLSSQQEAAIRSYVARTQEATVAIDLRTRAHQKLLEISQRQSIFDKAVTIKDVGSEIVKIQSDMAENGKQLTEQMLTSEERRLKVVKEAYDLLLAGNLSQETYDRIKLANAEQWTAETTAAYDQWVKTQEKIQQIADDLSYAITSVLIDGLRQGKLELEDIGNAIKDVFLNTLGDIISKWLSEWFKAMASWLARWIATQKAGQVAGSLQGSTQDGGNLSGAGVSAASKSGMSAGSLAGWALAAYALFVVYKAFIEDHKRRFTEVTISNGQITSIVSNTKQNFNDIQLGVQALLDSVKKLVTDLNLSVTSLGTVIIEASKSGFNVKMSATSTGQLFKTIEEAMAYAQTLMIKYGEFGDSVSSLVQSIIKSTKAMTPEELASDIDFARTLDTQNLSDLARQMQQDIDLARQQWTRAKELLLSFYSTDLPALAEAAQSIFTRLNTSVRAQFNSLMGIKEDPKKAWQDRVKQFEIEKKLALLQLTLWKQENEARIANYKLQGKIVFGGGGGGKGGGGLLGLAAATLKFAAAMDVATDQVDAGLQALLDIQKLIDDAINDINSLPTIDPAKDFPGTKGAGGRGGDRDNVRQFIQDRTFEISLIGLTDYQRALKELDHQYNDLLKQAGKDKELRAELLALKEKELELLAKEQIQSVVDQFQGFLGLVSPFDQVRKTAADLIKQIEGSPMGNERKAKMIGRVLAELDRQLENLAMQSSQQLLGEMLGDLEKFGIETGLQAEMRKNIAILEHTLKMIHYRQEIEILRASGKVSEATMKILDDGLRALEGVDPTKLPGAANDNGPTSSGSAYNQRMEQMAKANQAYIDKLKSAQSLLKKYQDAHLDQESALSKALRQINDDFKTIRDALGNTPEVIAAFNIAVRDAFKDALKGVQVFYDSLTSGSNAQLTIEQQYQQAQAEYQRILAEVLSGDYSELDKLDASAQNFIDLVGQMFGTSTGGFQEIRQQILDQLKQVLSLGELPAPVTNNILNFPLQQNIADSTKANVEATNRVASVVSLSSERQSKLLQSLVDTTAELAAEIRLSQVQQNKLGYGNS